MMIYKKKITLTFILRHVSRGCTSHRLTDSCMLTKGQDKAGLFATLFVLLLRFESIFFLINYAFRVGRLKRGWAFFLQPHSIIVHQSIEIKLLYISYLILTTWLYYFVSFPFHIHLLWFRIRMDWEKRNWHGKKCKNTPINQ